MFWFLFSIAFSNPYTCFWLGLTYLLGLLKGARVHQKFQQWRGFGKRHKSATPSDTTEFNFTSVWVILLGVVISVVDGFQVIIVKHFSLVISLFNWKVKCVSNWICSSDWVDFINLHKLTAICYLNSYTYFEHHFASINIEG